MLINVIIICCKILQMELVIGGSRIFLGEFKNEFIRICNDCIAVKTHVLS